MSLLAARYEKFYLLLKLRIRDTGTLSTDSPSPVVIDSPEPTFSHFQILPNHPPRTQHDTMSARTLLRHVLRHGSREEVTENALPLGMKRKTATAVVQTEHDTTTLEKKPHATVGTFAPLPKTPEPFGLEDIAEEALVSASSSIETASLTESFASLNLKIGSFTAREVVQATLEEAKTATHTHLDTINTTLALLDALDGLSATISELRKEMFAKKEACKEKLAMLDAFERALESMNFANEACSDMGSKSEE